MPGDPGGSKGRILAVSARPVGGTFAPSQSFLERPDPVTYFFGGASWAFDARGNTYLAWEDLGVVQLSTRPAGGAFSRPVAVSGPRVRGAVMGVDADGNARVAWLATTGSPQTPEERSFLQVRTLTSSGSLEPVQTLAEGRHVSHTSSDGDDDSFETLGAPSVVVSDAGQTTVSWETTDPRARATVTAVATSVANGSFSAPASVKGCPGSGLLGNGRGDVAVYCGGSGVAVRPAGVSGFGRLEHIRSPALSIDSAAMSRDGTIAIAASGGGEIFSYTLTSLRPPNGHFTPLRVLTGRDSVYPSFAFEPGGELTAAFRVFPPPGSFREPSLRVATFAPRYRMAPFVAADILNTTLRDTRKRGVSVNLSVPESEKLTVRLVLDRTRARQLHLGSNTRTIARSRLAMRSFRDRDIHIPLARDARRALRHLRRLYVSLVVSARTPDNRRVTYRWNALLSDKNEVTGIQ